MWIALYFLSYLVYLTLLIQLRLNFCSLSGTIAMMKNLATILSLSVWPTVFSGFFFKLRNEQYFLNNYTISIFLILQYVSCGWDETIRVWNAWKMPRRRKQTTGKDKERKKGSRHKHTSGDDNSKRGKDGGESGEKDGEDRDEDDQNIQDAINEEEDERRDEEEMREEEDVRSEQEMKKKNSD